MLLSSSDLATSAPQILRHLWTDKDFTDVTLVTEDNQQIPVHKAILSACSPFFRHLLVTNPHPKPLLYLRGIQVLSLYLNLPSLCLAVLTLYLNVPSLYLKVLSLYSKVLSLHFKVLSLFIKVLSLHLKVQSLHLKVRSLYLKVLSLSLNYQFTTSYCTSRYYHKHPVTINVPPSTLTLLSL